MPLCKIADRIVQLNCRYGYTPSLCRDYIVEGVEAEAEFSADEGEIEELRKTAGERFPRGYIESLVLYRKLCSDMLRHDGFLLHGSAVEYDGNAYLFTARSGVGKTTHTMLWLKEFAGEASVINGDKPIIRLVGDKFMVYGTPWSGKENMNANTSAPLKAICFIERGDHNECYPIDKKEAVKLIMQQVMMISDKELMFSELRLVDKMLDSVSSYKLICLPNEDAARTSFNAMVNP
jgi:hypothetical protein